MENTQAQPQQHNEGDADRVHPEVEDVDRRKGQAEPLVDNINVQAEEAEAPRGETPEEGVDNIEEEDADLREDLKGDPLGGSTRVPEADEDANASG